MDKTILAVFGLGILVGAILGFLLGAASVAP